MYRGRYEGKHSMAKKAPTWVRAPKNSRLTTILIAAMLFMTLAVGSTVAWLSAKDAPIQNKFLPSEVSCEVTEDFNGATGVKSKVNVKNTGDIDAFIRVKLVTYRTNEQGRHIGGTALVPSFTMGSDWEKYGDYYYYTLPVAPGDKPKTNLTDRMTLIGAYPDADGGKQAIDVMAEAIQSVPEDAVQTAWGAGFSIGTDGRLYVPNN